MNKNNLTIFEKLPYIILGLGFIGGIILGFVFKDEKAFNAFAMIAGWVNTIFLGLIFLAISEHLNGLSSIEDELKRLRYLKENE